MRPLSPDDIPEPAEEQSDDSYPPYEDEKANADLQEKVLRMQEREVELGMKRSSLTRSQIDNDRIQAENNLRDSVQVQVWELIRIWLAGVFFIVIFSGLKEGIPLCQGTAGAVSCMHFKLEYKSPVLVALISSPTVAIIGLVAIVLRYLFPNGESK